MKEVYLVVEGNYALSKKMHALSTKELAEGFRQHIRNDRTDDSECINIFKLVVDDVVLKEEDL